MRAVDLATGAFVVVLIGSGVGVMTFAWLPPGVREIARANVPTPPATPMTPSAPMQAAMTQVAIPTPGAIGSTGQLTAGSTYGRHLLWINNTGLWAWNRAYEERDEKGMSRVMEIYERLQVSDGTRVRVVNRDGATLQVEMLEGEHAGRRGWLMFASEIRAS